jgi:hypothetical protein
MKIMHILAMAGITCVLGCIVAGFSVNFVARLLWEEFSLHQQLTPQTVYWLKTWVFMAVATLTSSTLLSLFDQTALERARVVLVINLGILISFMYSVVKVSFLLGRNQEVWKFVVGFGVLTIYYHLITILKRTR